MVILTSAEISELRALDVDAMTSRCVIQRPTLTSDGMGGRNESWVAIGTVDCRLKFPNIQNMERIAGGQVLSSASVRLAVPVGTDLKATDRVVSGGKTYEVKLVPNGATWRTAIYAEVTALNEELRV